MREVLQLEDLPDIMPDSDSLNHMRVAEMEGEEGHSWCLQAMDDGGQRYVLPDWMGEVLELQVCFFVSEHSKWERKKAEKAAQGKSLTNSQKSAYEAWRSRCEPRLAFSARKKMQVTSASQVKRDKSSLAIQLHLSDSPEELQVSAWDGSRYLLLLLKGTNMKGPSTVPEVLAGDVPADVIEEMEVQDAAAEGEKDAVLDVLQEGDHEAEVDAIAGEMQDKALDMQKAQQDAGEQSEEDLEFEEGEYLLADTDEEMIDFHLVSKTVEKVKTFSFREAYQKLEKLDLVSLPRHVGGCSLSYHGHERRWQGLYPKAKVGMSYSWGGSTKRSECEALLSAVRAVLTAHCRAFPKDKLWAAQLEKVKVAEATHKF
eukprot:s954_g6.t1